MNGVGSPMSQPMSTDSGWTEEGMGSGVKLGTGFGSCDGLFGRRDSSKRTVVLTITDRLSGFQMRYALDPGS